MNDLRTFVGELFSKLSTGDSAAFFEHVADDVDWTVMGTHPLAGRYHDKQKFQRATFERLNNVMSGPIKLKVEHIYIDGNTAIVELSADATLKNGERFDNRYCWVTRFRDRIIVEVRAYLDSALVQRAIDQNEK